MTGDHIDSPPRTQTSSSGVATDLDARPIWRYGLRALWDALVGGIGLPRGGLLPHVLHHAGHHS